MQTMGIKSANAPHTMGIKQHRSPHTMGIKTHMVFRNATPSAYISEPVVQDNENLGLYEPLNGKSQKSRNKSRLEK